MSDPLELFPDASGVVRRLWASRPTLLEDLTVSELAEVLSFLDAPRPPLWQYSPDYRPRMELLQYLWAVLNFYVQRGDIPASWIGPKHLRGAAPSPDPAEPEGEHSPLPAPAQLTGDRLPPQLLSPQPSSVFAKVLGAKE